MENSGWPRGVEILSRGLADPLADPYASSDYDSGYGTYDATYDKSKGTEIDYSVLAVVVITLGLILVVEVVRHKIDHAAENRSFFRAVLDGVYGELSTLGIVEAGVHVVLEYIPSLDGKGKKVFADVHFLIFFVAVFNALMCVVLAYFSTNVSHHLWVVAEQLDLGHYVEAREEFDRIDAKLNELDRAVTPSTRESTTAESSFNFDLVSLRKLWRTIKLTIRRPVLKNRHRKLLMQIRFHELRVHFLRTNGLTLKLKVSDYLKRSEIHVLEHLVHISALSWVLLAGGTVLIYFVLGVLAYATEDPNRIIGAMASHVYVWANLFSIVTSLLLFNKMKWIFSRIMKTGLTKREHTTEISEEERQKQLDLFWGAHPAYVVSFVQFMQFGYAMAAAILLIYWKDIDKDGIFPAWAYGVSYGICYVVFVAVMANTLPRYTMCTSLGNLVDSSRLAETVAHFRLQETKRLDGDESTMMKSMRRGGATTDGAASRDSASDRLDSMTADGEALSQFSELIRKDTQSLRAALSEEQKQKLAEKRTERRVRRNKSNSDSRVAMMAQMKDDASKASDMPPSREGTADVADEGDTEVPLPKGRRRRRKKAASTGVAMMRSFNDENTNSDILATQELAVFDISALKAKGNFEDEDELGPVRLDDLDEEEEKKSLIEMLKMQYEQYALSSKYRLVSGVFGTLLCFFFIGMRVEVLMLENGHIDDPGNTFHFSTRTSFWLVFTWLGMMIVESSFRGGYFWKSHPEIRYACIIDLILASLCLSLLVWAEVERCCDLIIVDAETMESYQDTDCCQQFGTRTYGSVGNIEPFTSLIALRVFRFYVGRWIAASLHKMPEKPEKHHHPHHDNHDELSTEHGTITQLWEKAVSLYPNVVREHGELSGQLLKKMLGVKGSLVVLGDVESSGVENEEGLILIDPNSNLTRSMRRCDYMLLPLFDEWRPMDVLMTQHEMVFVEAMDLTEQSEKQLQVVRMAIAARKGGKGLRLADVLKGRKVISHIDLKSIEQIHVERFPASSCKTAKEYSKESMLSEFWYLNKDSARAHIYSRNTRWQAVQEDHLKIETEQGTFYLRFYADLDTAESNMKASDTVADPHVIHALRWARAIGRSCGTRQLKQPLPHFGEKLEAEDYLVQRHRGREEDHAHHTRIGYFMHNHMHVRGLPRRGSNSGSGELEEDHATQTRIGNFMHNHLHVRGLPRRSSSTGSGELREDHVPQTRIGNFMHNHLHMRGLPRRSSSMGSGELQEV